MRGGLRLNGSKDQAGLYLFFVYKECSFSLTKGELGFKTTGSYKFKCKKIDKTMVENLPLKGTVENYLLLKSFYKRWPGLVYTLGSGAETSLPVCPADVNI